MTPREFALTMEAKAKARQEKYKLMAWHACHIINTIRGIVSKHPSPLRVEHLMGTMKSLRQYRTVSSMDDAVKRHNEEIAAKQRSRR
jgi:hypothetical protein